MNMQAQRENSKRVNKLNAEFINEINNLTNDVKLEIKESKGYMGMRNYSLNITTKDTGGEATLHLTTAGKDAVELKEWIIARLELNAKEDGTDFKSKFIAHKVKQAWNVVNKYVTAKNLANDLEETLSKKEETKPAKKMKI